MRAVILICLAPACLLASREALAQGRPNDGVYGRLTGDVSLQVDVGPGIIESQLSAFTSVAARYLHTVGLYGTFSEDGRTHVHASSRSASLGVELRPLFLPRFTTSSQSGKSLLDMFIDSWALRMGAVVSRSSGFEPGAPGFEAGLLCGLPLTSQVAGPWVGAGLSARWSQPDAHAFTADANLTVLSTVTFGWLFPLHTHAVDAGDVRPK